jgi:hypothetical protein
MSSLRPVWLALVSTTIAAFAVDTRVHAQLDGQVYTSKAHRLRVVVPRGWRATDQASYPGLLLWMMRGQPEARMVLTAEPFTRELYCAWPIACRTSADALPSKFACALRAKLERLDGERRRIGLVQAGPKEAEQVGLPSVWFDHEDGTAFLRQAVIVTDDRVISLVLSAPSSEARAANARAFEQALRSMRPLAAEELASASTAEPDPAAPLAPAAKVDPVGPCTQHRVER